MCVCTSVCCGQCSCSVHDPKAAHELVVLVFILIYHLRAKKIFFFKSAFYPARALHRTQRTILLTRDGKGAAVCVCCALLCIHRTHIPFKCCCGGAAVGSEGSARGVCTPLLPWLPAKPRTDSISHLQRRVMRDSRAAMFLSQPNCFLPSEEPLHQTPANSRTGSLVRSWHPAPTRCSWTVDKQPGPSPPVTHRPGAAPASSCPRRGTAGLCSP